MPIIIVRSIIIAREFTDHQNKSSLTVQLASKKGTYLALLIHTKALPIIHSLLIPYKYIS